MAASSRLIKDNAERQFPVRVRVEVPSNGFGRQLPPMHAWLDDNCGADGWAITPAGIRGIVNDAVAIYFSDPAFAVAFVARWCRRSDAESVHGAFQMRQDEPTQRVPMEYKPPYSGRR